MELRIDPVYVYELQLETNDKIEYSGSLFLSKKKEGIFLKWVLDQSKVGKSVLKNNLKHPKSPLNFNLDELKSVTEKSSELSEFKMLIFELKCGSITHFHVPSIDSKNLIENLQKLITLNQSTTNPSMYVVKTKKTFDDFNLFTDPSDSMSRFLSNPIAGLTKVTKYLNEFSKLSSSRESLHGGRTKNSSASSSLIDDSKDFDTFTLNCGSEWQFITKVVKKGDLPKRPPVVRKSPITARDWSSLLDNEGRIVNAKLAKQMIFRGGIDGSIRREVWKFLLGFYAWDSTIESREKQRKNKLDDYSRMKKQWESMDENQLNNFSAFKERKSLAEKDVWRTDRNHTFYEGLNNPNICIMLDILMTHCMYNFDLGYVQGMSDLLSPILLIMEHEVDAFWCFTGFTKLISQNFDKDQQSMKNQLFQLQFLIKFLDPHFSDYLDKNESFSMTFCFRWLLILFKREFSFPDIMYLWEVLWTGLPCQNFHLLISIAILDTIKATLIEEHFGFTEILKFVNGLSGQINVKEVLKVAESIFLQLSSCPNLCPTIAKILGLNELESEDNPSFFNSFNPFQHNLSLAKKDSKNGSSLQSPVSGSSNNPSPTSNLIASHDSSQETSKLASDFSNLEVDPIIIGIDF